MERLKTIKEFPEEMQWEVHGSIVKHVLIK